MLYEYEVFNARCLPTYTIPLEVLYYFQCRECDLLSTVSCNDEGEYRNYFPVISMESKEAEVTMLSRSTYHVKKCSEITTFTLPYHLIF